jgi:hypothetical protein
LGEYAKEIWQILRIEPLISGIWLIPKRQENSFEQAGLSGVVQAGDQVNTLKGTDLGIPEGAEVLNVNAAQHGPKFLAFIN